MPVAAGLYTGSALAIDDVIETPQAFLTEAFGATPPEAKFLELDGNAQSQIAAALGHPYQQSRLRYWLGNGQTAWIFDDKGKEGYQMTTSGFVVKGGVLQFARVIIYRESHGEEVTQASFLKQFEGAKANGTAIDKHVDGISGATLSVLMMQRMARAAITLDALAVSK